MIKTISLVTIHHHIDTIKRKGKEFLLVMRILRIYLLCYFPVSVYITYSNVNYRLHVLHCIPSTYLS